MNNHLDLTVIMDSYSRKFNKIATNYCFWPEQFTNGCRKAKIKEITLANHEGYKQYNIPIKPQSKSAAACFHAEPESRPPYLCREHERLGPHVPFVISLAR